MRALQVIPQVADPISLWGVSVTVPTNMKEVNNFISEYDNLMLQFDAEVKNFAESLRLRHWSKTRSIGINIRKSSQSRKQIKLWISLVPQSLVSLARKPRNIIYVWLWSQSIQVNIKPHTLFLISPRQLDDLSKTVERARSLQKTINSFACSLYENKIRDSLLKLLERYNIQALKQKLELKELPLPDVIVLPFVLERTEEPLVARSAQQIMEKILKHVVTVIKSSVSLNSYAHKKLLTKVEKYCSILADMGLAELSETIRATVLETVSMSHCVADFQLLSKILEEKMRTYSHLTAQRHEYLRSTDFSQT